MKSWITAFFFISLNLKSISLAADAAAIGCELLYGRSSTKIRYVEGYALPAADISSIQEENITGLRLALTKLQQAHVEMFENIMVKQTNDISEAGHDPHLSKQQLIDQNTVELYTRLLEEQTIYGEILLTELGFSLQATKKLAEHGRFDQTSLKKTNDIFLFLAQAVVSMRSDLQQSEVPFTRDVIIPAKAASIRTELAEVLKKLEHLTRQYQEFINNQKTKLS